MKKITAFVAEFGPLGRHSVAGSIFAAPVFICVVFLLVPPILKFYGWWFRLWGI